MSYDLYVKNDEIINSLCVDKIGDMVTLRKDLHDESGVFHKDTVFRIEKITVNSKLKISKVLSSELNKYEADPRIFIYDISIPETDIEIKNVNSDHFHKPQKKLNMVTLLTWAMVVISVILLSFKGDKGDDMNTAIDIVIMITIVVFITISCGIFEKPDIYKKHTK